MEEVEKYRGLYASPQHARYGHTNHGAKAIPILEREGITQVLDIGCGWNEFAKDLRARGWKAIGLDFACPGADLIHDIATDRLPFPDQNWQCVTAFDMLEHLRPDQVDRVLGEMARVARRFIVSISYVPSRNTWQGENLHPTVREEAWWIDALTRAGAVGIRKVGHYLTGRWERLLRLEPSTRVCLVGNGPGLLAASRGAAIDDHDFVVRFNNYKIAGFEPHTGTRIDLWSTVGGATCGNEAACPRALLVNEGFPEPPGLTEVYRLPRSLYGRYRRLAQERAWLRSGCRIDPEPLLASSGLMVALWFLDRLGIESVTLAGFDHFGKAASQWHHYWIPRNTKAPTEHDGAAEAEVFADLERAGRVRRL